MERTQIEHFVAVVEFHGFTAAAKSLYVTQPALSHSIKTLERELGVTLFHRLGRGVKLTYAGEVFFESALNILRELDLARTRVQEIGSVVVGRLDMMALPGLLLNPLGALVGRFREVYPSVTIRVLHVQTNQEVREAVRTGAVELAVTDDDAEIDTSLTSHLIYEDDFVALMPPGSQLPDRDYLDIDDLLRMAIIIGPPGSHAREFLRREAKRVNRQFVPAVEVGLRGSSLFMVLAGAGVGLLPRPFAELGEANGGVMVGLEPKETRRIYLLHRKAELSPAARAMVNLLLDECRINKAAATSA